MKKLLFITIAILFLLPACAASSKTVSLTAVEAGKTVELNIGDTLQISLEGNPGTGYSWIASPQDPTLLEAVGEPEFKASSDLLGAPGMVTMKYKAIAQGQAALRLEYRRSWETGVEPEKVYEVTVVVK